MNKAQRLAAKRKRSKLRRVKQMVHNKVEVEKKALQRRLEGDIIKGISLKGSRYNRWSH